LGAGLGIGSASPITSVVSVQPTASGVGIGSGVSTGTRLRENTASGVGIGNGISIPTRQAQVSAAGVGIGSGTAVSATIPNSVEHQYLGDNFTTSTWTDSIGSADMSINGPSASTLNGDRAASSDGVDDFGLADGPATLPNRASFSIAMTVQTTDTTTSRFFGELDNASDFSRFSINIPNSGEFRIVFADDAPNVIAAKTLTGIADGNAHLVVVNVPDPTDASSIEFFIDDMVNPQTTTVIRNENFQPGNYSANGDLGFFAQNSTGSQINNFRNMTAGLFEFNTEPYSSTERQNLKQRAPGL
jgi:hypothetical protein